MRGGEGVKGEVKNISHNWLQGIFETVPNSLISGNKVKIIHMPMSGTHHGVSQLYFGERLVLPQVPTFHNYLGEFPISIDVVRLSETCA